MIWQIIGALAIAGAIAWVIGGLVMFLKVVNEGNRFDEDWDELGYEDDPEAEGKPYKFTQLMGGDKYDRTKDQANRRRSIDGKERH